MKTECCNALFVLDESNDNTGPIYWNDMNQVVQCHHCGAIYTPNENATKMHKITAVNPKEGIGLPDSYAPGKYPGPEPSPKERGTIVLDNKHMERDYYNSGKIKPIDFAEEQDMNGNIFSVFKYIVRAGKKDPEKHVEDLEKAKWYLDREINKVKAIEYVKLSRG